MKKGLVIIRQALFELLVASGSGLAGTNAVFQTIKQMESRMMAEAFANPF